MTINNPDHEPLNGVFTASKPKQIKLKIGLKGGSGSGNWGHRGRPGKEGGSMPGKGGGGGVEATAGIKPGKTPPMEIQLPGVAGTKLPEHQPGDASGLADYKAWYQAQVAAGQTPSLGQAIQMRQQLADRAQQLEQQASEAKATAAEAAANSPEAKAAAEAAAAEEAKKKAELAKKVADAKKKKKGGAAKKPKAPAKPKAGKGAAKKKKPEKEPAWKKGLVEPPVMSGTTIPDAVFEERGEDTYQTWLNDNPETVSKLTDMDKEQVYNYFTQRSQNLAKDAKDPWAQVYIPDRPYSMIKAGLDVPAPSVVTEVTNAKERPSGAEAGKLYDYLQGKSKAELAKWRTWYDSRVNAEHQKAIIPRTKPSPPGTKELHKRIIIHVGLKGSSTSGNFGHSGRPGKLGGSVPKGSGAASTGIELKSQLPSTVRISNSISGTNPQWLMSDGRVLQATSDAFIHSRVVQFAAKQQFAPDDAWTELALHNNWVRIIDGGTMLHTQDVSKITPRQSKTLAEYLKTVDDEISIQNDKQSKAEVYVSAKILKATDYDLPKAYAVADRMATKQLHVKLGVKGGPSSGNWGHAGRPGKLGGSVPKSTALSATTGPDAEQRRQDKVTLANQQFPEHGFPTSQAAQDWANKAYPDTQFDLAAGGHTVINPTLKAYTTVAQKYPDIAKQIKQVSLGPVPTKDDVISIARDGSRITLNSDMFKRGEAGADLRALTREAVKAGFYPAGAGVGHYILHAFGQNVLNKYNSNPATNAKLTTWLNANFSKARSVSILAASGKAEFFGELFGAAFGTNSKVPVVSDFKAMLEQLGQPGVLA